MKPKVIFPVLIVTGVMLSLAQAEPPGDTKIQRGKYLVEQVAICGECHSPRDDKGQFIRAEWLQGDVINYKPLNPGPWAPVAPGIAGLPTFKTDEQAVKFFETGTNNYGRLALPPMPQFRFSHEDAVAVTAYLRSLKK